MALKRRLGFWSVFCIASGAMISSGLFVLPGLAFRAAGPAVVLSYALAGLLVLPALLSQAELATAMPRAGGSYFFIERSLGALPGTLAGLANWLSIALKAAFALIGIGAFAELVFPGLPPWAFKGVAVACCTGFATLNLLSVKGVGRAQVAMVAGLLAVLGLFVVAGMGATRHAHFAGFADKGALPILATAGMVFVSFGGLTKVASVAEEVRHPGRNLPLGMFAAVGVVTLLYVAAVFVTVGTVEADRLSGSLTPLSLAAEAFLGRWGTGLLSLAAVLAFVTTANSGILSASRSPMAMSRDGLLPGALRSLWPRFGTPWLSILLTAGFIIAVIAALTVDLLVKAASAMMLMLFVLVNLAVIIMRRSRIQNYRPLYRAPFCPWLQIAGTAAYLFLIARMGLAPLLATGGFVVVGLIWYAAYVHPRIARESAFVYLVKRIVSRDVARSRLEEELKQIALERDEVTHDRFDRLVSTCPILDLQGSRTADDVFRAAAAALAPRLDMTEDDLFERFREREAQSSTVVQPGLAIPHVIVPGRSKFEILPIRCREGASFPGQGSEVHVVFILAGSVDERNYHLKALMAVAHVVGEQDFVRRWLAAGEAEHLRDLLLMSGRTREPERPEGGRL